MIDEGKCPWCPASYSTKRELLVHLDQRWNHYEERLRAAESRARDAESNLEEMRKSRDIVHTNLEEEKRHSNKLLDALYAANEQLLLLYGDAPQCIRDAILSEKPRMHALACKGGEFPHGTIAERDLCDCGAFGVKG